MNFKSIIEKNISFSMIILIILLFIELFLEDRYLNFEIFLKTLEYLIYLHILIYLIFKYLELTSFPKFFKKYWRDLLVIFPFFIVFKILNEFFIIFKINKLPEILLKKTKIKEEILFIINEEKRSKRIFRLSHRLFKSWPRIFSLLKKIYHRN